MIEKLVFFIICNGFCVAGPTANKYIEHIDRDSVGFASIKFKKEPVVCYAEPFRKELIILTKKRNKKFLDIEQCVSFDIKTNKCSTYSEGAFSLHCNFIKTN
jgi:hypothetical protein